MQDENQVVALKARSCISQMKDVYPTAGKLYGYLSTFSHWGHLIHGHFLDFNTQEAGVSVLTASVRYRALALALCIVILDAVVEVVRKLYSDRGNTLIEGVQGVLEQNAARSAYLKLSSIVETTKLKDLAQFSRSVPFRSAKKLVSPTIAPEDRCRRYVRRAARIRCPWSSICHSIPGYMGERIVSGEIRRSDNSFGRHLIHSSSRGMGGRRVNVTSHTSGSARARSSAGRRALR